MTRVLAAAGLCAALAAPAAAAPARTAVVELGDLRAYVRSDQAVPLAGVELFVRAGLDRQTATQSGLAALVAESVLRTPVDPSPGSGQAMIALADAVDARGAAIGYAVAQQQVRFFIEGTPDGLAASAPLAARALAAPSFDPAVLAAARTALGERIADEELDPAIVGVRMLRTSYYRGGAGLPALGTPAGLAALTPADARTFHERWYLRGGAFVAAVGHTGEATDAAARALAGALRAGSVAAERLATRPFASQPKRIVTHRDVSAPYIALGFAAPALGDADFAAALVVRALLTSVFDRVSATTQPPPLRSVGAVYGYETTPAQLILWLNGGRIDAVGGLATLDAVVKGAAVKRLSPAVLERYKETARGEWALQTLTLDERAFAIGNAVAQGLDADACDAVGPAIRRVTAADVQRVVKKYFRRFDVALVMPRARAGG
jgi:zinc protease